MRIISRYRPTNQKFFWGLWEFLRMERSCESQKGWKLLHEGTSEKTLTLNPMIPRLAGSMDVNPLTRWTWIYEPRKSRNSCVTVHPSLFEQLSFCSSLLSELLANKPTNLHPRRENGKSRGHQKRLEEERISSPPLPKPPGLIKTLLGTSPSFY